MNNNFSENLIKGRIVETIFQQMFLDTRNYHVYPFGYVQTLPTLAQANHDPYVKSLIQDIRHLPDFVLTPKTEDGVYLIEVKYERELDFERIKEFAYSLHNSWTCPWLFVATQEKFYFDSCSEIINGSLKELDSEKWVSTEIQDYYLSLLHKFLK